MRTRIDTLLISEKNTERKKIGSELLKLRRAGAAVLIGAVAISLAGCKERGFEADTFEAGTIEETRAVLGDDVLALCLDGTLYDIDGKGAEWSEERFGEYHEGSTNAVIEITPEAGGETLLLEQTMSSLARPTSLIISPLTDQELLKEAGCDPADLPEPKEDYILIYNVEENSKKLKDHHIID